MNTHRHTCTRKTHNFLLKLGYCLTGHITELRQFLAIQYLVNAIKITLQYTNVGYIVYRQTHNFVNYQFFNPQTQILKFYK